MGKLPQQSTFAWALMVASAEENKRSGAEIVGKSLGTRTRAELSNLTTIHHISGLILLEEAKAKYHCLTLPLELLAKEYQASIYYEVGEDLDIVAVYLDSINILPLLSKDAVQEVYAAVEEELTERRAEMQAEILEEQRNATLD